MKLGSCSSWPGCGLQGELDQSRGLWCSLERSWVAVAMGSRPGRFGCAVRGQIWVEMARICRGLGYARGQEEERPRGHVLEMELGLVGDGCSLVDIMSHGVSVVGQGGRERHLGSVVDRLQ